MENNISDIDLIAAIREGGNKRLNAWKYLYQNWFNHVALLIIKSGGTKDDVSESISEISWSFEKAICKLDFRLEKATLKTYFTTCVFNNWKKNKRKNTRLYFDEIEEHKLTNFVESVEANIVKRELTDLIDQTLSEIGERCKKILVLFMNNYSMNEISQELKFLNEQVAKNEKGKCQHKYEHYLKNNPNLLQQIITLRNDQ